ncbi:hypothetical protein TNCV_4275671 [Trichonephila clavipes]|nr:hypothetical protein TNCV_4275671 [Trichonephila clavipes]
MEESPEKKRLGRWRIEIGAEREERPWTPVALETIDHERWWRWRTGIHGLERFVLSDKGLISRDIDRMHRLGV